MTPFYQHNGITIYCGDCLEVMPKLEPGFDAAITDPPYGNNTKYDNYNDSRENLKKLIGGFFTIARRTSKRMAITCGVANMWLYSEPSWVLNWTDPSGQGGCPWGFPSWQPILVYGKDPYLQSGKGRRSDTKIKRYLRGKGGESHPCPKPLGLMKWLINRVSLDGLILDPFMGSGTTLQAAQDLDRRAVGIEMSEEYCRIAVKRLRQQSFSFPARSTNNGNQRRPTTSKQLEFGEQDKT